METTIARLSRPLLIKTDDNSYQTVYGFALKDNLDRKFTKEMDMYAGYLAGLNDWSNGGHLFSVANPYTGFPFWIDRQGYIHNHIDAWMKGIFKKCRKKLNLTYDIIRLEIDGSLLNCCLNEDRLIVDETFYLDLKRYMGEEDMQEVQIYNPYPEHHLDIQSKKGIRQLKLKKKH